LEAREAPVGLAPDGDAAVASPRAAMTIIKISDPALLELLLADLRDRPDVIAEVAGPDRLRVSVLGSYNQSAMRMAILLRVRAWEAAQRARGFDVEVDLE
jgi:hypothetical protein